MKIALVSGNPHLPQLYGGVEVNTHELAHELISAGHEVQVVAKLSPRDLFGASRLVRAYATGRRVQRDTNLGYPVHRSRRPWEQLASLPPVDVAVIQNGEMIEFGAAFRALGIPSVAYFFGLNFQDWDRSRARNPSALPFRGYLVLSQFIAGRLKQLYGIDAHVVPPIFRKERYSTDVTPREVTFINPVPVKGVELALKIAALCPDIAFGFVLGWPQSTYSLARLKRAIGKLPNVRLRDGAKDMRLIYRDTKVLLVPSQWEAETWGRVASEAHFSGIPVVASNRGGLPEAVGPGGIILGYDEHASKWAEAIRKLWYDDSLYKQLSADAARYAARPLLDPVALTRSLVSALENATQSAN